MQAHNKLAGYRILLIDDNPDHQEILEFNLREIPGFDCPITKATSFEEGMKAFEANTYDLVFLDMNLPDSMVDQTVPDFLAKRPYPAPIIVMSSLQQRIMLKGLPNESTIFHLSKVDLNPEALLSVIEQAFESIEE